MIKLKALKVFMLAVEEGSIVRAAKLLNFSKAAASKQLIELEKNLNIQLLQRTTRTLKLTDVGESYYESVKKIFMAIEDSQLVVEQTKDKLAGTLKIMSHRYFGEKYIVDNLKEFMNMHPSLKIDLELADRFPDLEKENIDILCGVAHEGSDNLVRRKISKMQHIYCASPDYLNAYGIPRTPDELKKHQYITHSFRSPDNLIILNNKKIYINYCIRINDAQSMLKCALNGLGIIRIHNYIAEEALRKHQLIEVLAKYKEPEKPIYVFYRQQRFVQPKIRSFLDFLYANINKTK